MVMFKKTTMTEQQWRELSRDDLYMIRHSQKIHLFDLPDWFDYTFYFAYFVIASCAVIVVTNNLKRKV
jgi:hypothetical protein